MIIPATAASVTEMGRCRVSWIWPALACLFAFGLYAPLLPPLVREWATFPSLSHGFAVPVVAAYVVWIRRKQLAAMAIAPCAWGLLILLLGLSGLVVGVRGHEPFVARLSLPVTLLALTLLLLGIEATRHLWIAICYLVFMIPLPWSILKLAMYRDRLLDAAVSAHILGWFGVPVNRDGTILHLPNVSLEVTDDCSSIPAIAALVSLGVAYASLGNKRLGVRVALISATVPLAVASNIIRIATTAAGAHYVGAWTLNTVFHYFSGTVNFLVTLLLMLSLGTAIQRLARTA